MYKSLYWKNKVRKWIVLYLVYSVIISMITKILYSAHSAQSRNQVKKLSNSIVRLNWCHFISNCFWFFLLFWQAVYISTTPSRAGQRTGYAGSRKWILVGVWDLYHTIESTIVNVQQEKIERKFPTYLSKNEKEIHTIVSRLFVPTTFLLACT